MVKRTFSKQFMLGVGILAALVILFSNTFQKETDNFLAKITSDKTEKSAKSDKVVIIQAPSEAIQSGQAAEKEDANASVIREIVEDQDMAKEKPTIIKTFLSDFFKTLFRSYISPQAP